MKSFLVMFSVLFLFATSVAAEEQIDLTVPDQAMAGTATYKVASIAFNWEHGLITITLRGTDNHRKQVLYGQNTGGTALMQSLNKMDFSTKSMHRRIMEKLIADGHLVGTISGLPD